MTTDNREQRTSDKLPQPRAPRGLLGRLEHRWRASGAAERWWHFGNWFFNWWDPPADSADASCRRAGASKDSRLVLVWGRMRRRFGESALGWRGREAYDRFYVWWYPVLEEPFPDGGYDGRKRKSRPVAVWRRFKRWSRQSWLGRRFHE